MFFVYKKAGCFKKNCKNFQNWSLNEKFDESSLQGIIKSVYLFPSYL